MRTRIAVLVSVVLLVPLVAFAGPIKDDPTGQIVAREGKAYLEQREGNRILYLEGTPYELGYQHGKLLKEDITKLVGTLDTFWARGAHETDQVIDLKETLRKAYARLAPFIPERYKQEMQGLADGSGVPLETAQIMNVLPELFHCSGFALFGKATKDGTLYHGRILDYATSAGLQDHALLIVAKPSGYNGFVNVSFAGSLGSVTGMNARHISIGEMGGRGVGKWDGCPMTFLVRRALEEAASLEDVMKIFTETPRTCEYYYVFADGNKRDARGVAAVPEKIEFIAPGQTDPRLPEAVPDAVLLSADERYRLLVERTRASHGKIGVEEAVRLMDRPVAMKSNLHSVLFVPEKLLAWVAYAGPDGEPAANRTYYGYDFSELLK